MNLAVDCMQSDASRRFFEAYAKELHLAATDADVRRWYAANAEISMCHRDMLIGSTTLARQIGGVIVEFGAYVGGTTVALGRGAKAAGGRVITIEKGGAYDHPVIPSTDILADLRDNIAAHDLQDCITIIESDYQSVAERLREELAGEKVGLFLVDADRHFEQSFNIAREFLLPDAIVMIDDYRAPFAPEKEELTKPQVDGLVAAGELTGWGALYGVTWIGELGGGDQAGTEDKRSSEKPRPLDDVELVPMDEVVRITGSSGMLRAARLPSEWRQMADDETDSASPLLLFEDGKLVGPAHSPHKLVADHGGGSYSHWRDALWFSSSDTLPPELNNRTYTAMLGDQALNFCPSGKPMHGAQPLNARSSKNPHFDDDLVVWDDAYSGRYDSVSYDEQFDGQWKLFLEGQEGFVEHTGVDTSDEYIDDRIRELTDVPEYVSRKRFGILTPFVMTVNGGRKRAERRGVGGRLHIEPKFPIDYWRGKRCIDVGCGAGRWTRTLLELGATVKSVDVSEHGLKSTARFNRDVENLSLFDIGSKRPDLHEAFDFTICWGVVMCTHDPLIAFENVAKTVKPDGELYLMVYAPTYHASEFVTSARKRYHRDKMTFEERLAFVYELAGDDRANAINYLDMLNTEYNWTIDVETIRGWAQKFGFSEPHFLNEAEPHKGAHHVMMRKRPS
ncbi:MAG: methyltransferase domain-containing protein [Roseitalea sp.]|nr:methyltransferase domain-containing protein [Roseitalea sp.]MBO6950918.1 methyltransferase domain-containing protein [Rhizobiaceae bacterium]MBO6591095.1 methyltransferase domain-containing protein [Roseitalea sp.]MBO6599647.1 methyltransferase domain-containing protein [Roseitalea sp.]MBO6613898.1 methyltransferase domain-containing protein [Roseitalea sp.]